jgi:probable F420-dependent oxidoreductase
MGEAGPVDAARQALGPVGVYLPAPFSSTPPVSRQREAAGRLEHAGYRAAWLNEPVGGRDPLVQAALLLEATERMTFGTGIANIWARAPQTAHAAAAMLADAYPGRIVLGLGAGYAQQAAAVGREFGRPLAALRDYLERMTAPTTPPAIEAPYARVVAANGPKMLALARDLADGALPAGLPPAFTAQVRDTIGPDKLLVAGMSTITDTASREAARAEARQAVAASLSLRPSQAATIARLGFSERQIADVSDDLVGALVAHGDPDSIAALAAAHRAAGADHVILMPPMSAAGAGLMTGVGQLERLAPALLQVRLHVDCAVDGKRVWSITQPTRRRAVRGVTTGGGPRRRGGRAGPRRRPRRRSRCGGSRPCPGRSTGRGRSWPPPVRCRRPP